MSTIGERIKQLRTKSGLSLQELAELVGKSKGNISGDENDKYEPSAQTIISIAKYFKVSTDWILTGNDFKSLELKENNINFTILKKDTLEMFQFLDESDKEDILEFVEFKYEKSAKKKEQELAKGII